MGGRTWVAPGISAKEKEALEKTNPANSRQEEGRIIQVCLKGGSYGAAYSIFSFIVCLLEREGLPLSLAPEGVPMSVNEWRPWDNGADQKVLSKGIDICVEGDGESQLIHHLFHTKAIRIGQQHRTLVVSDPVFITSSAKKRNKPRGSPPPPPSA